VNEPTFEFGWPRLQAMWHVERPRFELSPTAALAAAGARLERAHATVDFQPGEEALRFGYSLRAGRSWLACVAGGNVRTQTTGDRLVVSVAASPWPLLLYAAFGAIAVRMGGLGTPWLVGVIIVLLGGNYLAVHFGLRSVAQAVAGAPPAARAA
jgi:hypothetical protein